MLPPAIENLTEKFRLFPGIGFRGGQKLALDVLQMKLEDYEGFWEAIREIREKVKFCEICGFFAEERLCELCASPSRQETQICLVEKPTDVISLERSEIYRGRYHVLGNLISPLENIFPENTNLDSLFSLRLPKILEKYPDRKIEIILFFKAGFSAEATTAYLREMLIKKGLQTRVQISRLAQGLPLYYNPETLDQATMVRALEDRLEVEI